MQLINMKSLNYAKKSHSSEIDIAFVLSQDCRSWS